MPALSIIFPLSFLILLGSMLLPVSTQALLNQIFAFLLSPVTVLIEYTQTFVAKFKDRNKKILESCGIKNDYTQRSIGTSILFLISVVALLCDIDLVVLTLQALEIVQTNKNSFSILHLLGLNLNPAELLAIAIISSASVWGIIFLDVLKITTFTPNFLFEGDKSRVFSIAISVLSILMMLLSISILITLSFVRWDALNFNPDNASFSNFGEDVLFIFMGTSVLAFFTSMIAFLVIVAFGGVLAICFHTILIVPIFIVHLILRIINQIITLAYNLFLAISNLISGLTTGLRNRLQKNNTITEYNQNNDQQQQIVNQNQAVQPLTIANDFGDFTGNNALVLGNEPVEINLQNFVVGGNPPYQYQIFVNNPEIVNANLIQNNIVTLQGLKIGSTISSIRVTDNNNNIIEYQFNVEVIGNNNNNVGNLNNNQNDNQNNYQDNDEEGFNPLDF